MHFLELLPSPHTHTQTHPSFAISTPKVSSAPALVVLGEKFQTTPGKSFWAEEWAMERFNVSKSIQWKGMFLNFKIDVIWSNRKAGSWLAGRTSTFLFPTVMLLLLCQLREWSSSLACSCWTWYRIVVGYPSTLTELCCREILLPPRAPKYPLNANSSNEFW